MNVENNTVTIKDQQDKELRDLYTRLYEAQDVISSILDYDCDDYAKHILKIEWTGVENAIFSQILRHPSTLRNRDRDIQQFTEEIEYLRELIKTRHKCSEEVEPEYLYDYNKVTEQLNIELLNNIRNLENYRYQYCDFSVLTIRNAKAIA